MARYVGCGDHGRYQALDGSRRGFGIDDKDDSLVLGESPPFAQKLRKPSVARRAIGVQKCNHQIAFLFVIPSADRLRRSAVARRDAEESLAAFEEFRPLAHL